MFGIMSRLRSAKRRLRRMKTPRALRQFDKFHLGAGTRQLEGWANIDIEGRDNLLWDLRDALPIEPGKVRLIYSEHFLEHITRDDGLRLLKHARMVLAGNGVMRLSTPNLGEMAKSYVEGRIVGAPFAGWEPKTTCQALNEGMRLWGHQYVYDEPELRSLLSEAGFSSVRRMAYRESSVPEFQGIESRPDLGELIFEARP